MTQHDLDPYALLDSLRAGGDVDLIRTSIEQSLETQKRVWENGRIANICTDHHFRLTERAHRSTDLVSCVGRQSRDSKSQRTALAAATHSFRYRLANRSVGSFTGQRADGV